VPKVTAQFRFGISLFSLAFLFSSQISAQVGHVSVPANARILYEQLRTVGLDSSRVYQVRDASLDRSALHISLNDGTIAFTQDVAGRITGAFFAGDGEVLLAPPNQTERSSMALFTGAAILEEKFSTAYLRFNDDTFKELEAFLRPSTSSAAFVAQWNEGAQGLAADDALRLLMSFSRLLPVRIADSGRASALDPNGQMLHLKVQGRTLGIFDLFFDATAREQIVAGQLKKANGVENYDVWTSFALTDDSTKKRKTEVDSEMAGEEEDQGDIEISKYRISAEISPPTQLDADARLEMTVHRSGERALLFELSRYLKIREVKADGHDIEFIHNPSLEGTRLDRQGDDLVAIIFPEPLRAGQHIELYFSYGGAVLSDAGSGLLYVGARGTWYPNRGLSKAIFDMEFSYPQSWTLVATGTRQNERKSGESSSAATMPHSSNPASGSEQKNRWISERPIPVAGFNLGKYVVVSKHAGPVKIDVYAASAMERAFPQPREAEILPGPPIFPAQHSLTIPVLPLPPSPARNALSVCDDAARAVAFYASRFGPYPYNDFSITQMPGPLSQGWPGLIFLSSFSFLTDDQKSALHMSPVDQVLSDEIIAHETAHQWWGDLVMWSGYRDQWISEALANYSSLLLLESGNPSKFRAVLEKYRTDLLEKNKDGLGLMDAGPVTLGSRLSSSKFPDGYETIAYERGTWLFHMLRTMMRDTASKSPRQRGNEPFLEALHTLAERYSTRPIDTADLMRVFAELLPRSSWHENRDSLDWFYQGWITGTAIPELELHGVKYSDQANSTLATGTIKQKDAPDTLVTSVPLYASLGGKNVLLGRVFADGPETQFRLAAPRGTRKILLDPYQTVLSRPH
jgi:hypothetical protein